MKLRFDKSLKVWPRLWSVRFALAAAVVTGLQQVLPLWQPIFAEVPYAALSTALALLAAVARVVHQPQAQARLDGGAA